MLVNDLRELAKTNFWWIVGAVVLLALGLIVYLSLPEKLPTTPATSINEALAIAQKPLLAQIEDQKKQVADYKSRLAVSESKYRSLVDKYIALEKRKQDVKPPETDAEIRSRFTALGYPPLAVK